MNTDANLIEKAKKNNVIPFYPSLTSSVSDWKHKMTEEIKLFRRRVFDNYDFEGIISKKILDQTESLIDKLPLSIISPEIGINSDGTILLEWAIRESDDNMTMLSIIINEDDLIFSLMNAGSNKHYEAALFSEYSIGTIKNILGEYFEKTINTKKIRCQ